MHIYSLRLFPAPVWANFFQSFRRTALPLIVVLFSGLSNTPEAAAYDEDIHFYMTYIVARYAGIDHYTAMYMGVGSQWIDVSAISSPMNPLALIGTRMRRSNHFPAHRQKVGASHSHGVADLKLFSETRPNHPFGSDGIMAAMKLGDLMRLSYSTHRWQDTYAHAGNTAEFGHGLLGHQPDRFYQEKEKTTEMIRGLMMLMTRVRRLLPDVAVDKEFRDGNGGSHYLLDERTLADKFLAREDVQQLLTNDYLIDERYTRYTVNYLLAFYQERGLIHQGIDFRAMIDRLEKRMAQEGLQLFAGSDVRSILKTLFKAALQAEENGIDIINDDLFEQVLVGYPVHEYVRVDGAVATREMTLKERIDLMGKDFVVDQIVQELTAHVVPENFSDEHKVEFEVEGPTRARELSVRRRDFRDLIATLYGRNVKFYELNKMPKLLGVFGKVKRLLSQSEREAYNEAKLAEKVGESIRRDMSLSPEDDQPEIATLPRWDRVLYVLKHLKEDWWDAAVYYSTRGKKGNNRFVAHPDSILWQQAEQFDLMLEGGVVKPLLTNEQHAELVAFYNEVHRAYKCGELLVK